MIRMDKSADRMDRLTVINSVLAVIEESNFVFMDMETFN